jgi:branched-subunit amino acid aminotransferase/4-amino-4-deoxychorismate lyase
LIDSADRIELNGLPVQIGDLRALVQTNYGHFTAMRVEDGGVRGLDLHLARLDASTQALFGVPLEAERVRAYLRHIVSGAGELSLRINVFARGLDRDRLDLVVAPDVLVMASVSRPAVVTPMRVKSFVYARDTASVKHVGTFPLFHHRRLAQLDGFDDALFADGTGRISEGSIWNVGFVDAEGAFVWPDAPQLDGISMQLLKAGLARHGLSSSTRHVHLADLLQYRAAFFTNASVPVRPIASIDAHHFNDAGANEWIGTLQRCYESNPIQEL